MIVDALAEASIQAENLTYNDIENAYSDLREAGGNFNSRRLTEARLDRIGSMFETRARLSCRHRQVRYTGTDRDGTTMLECQGCGVDLAAQVVEA
jgi:hypothetical protein